MDVAQGTIGMTRWWRVSVTHVDVCVPPSATLWRNTLQMLTWSCSCFAWPGLFPMPPTTTK